jgi:hypothetical protein
LNFASYTSPQLQEILRTKLGERGLKIVAPDALRWCAMKVTKTHASDVRKAVELCWYVVDHMHNLAVVAPAVLTRIAWLGSGAVRIVQTLLINACDVGEAPETCAQVTMAHINAAEKGDDTTIQVSEINE